jgi:autotransporter-associated beta strand protein
VTLANEVSFAMSGNSTVSAAPGTTLTLASVMMSGGNAVFGSAGNTGAVIISPQTFLGGSTIEVAYGTLRNGGGVYNLTGLTANITSTTVDAEATLDGNDFSMTVNSLLGKGLVTLGMNAATVLTVDGGSFSGVISGAGQVDKETGGTLTLAGANTYSGGTKVGAGELIVSGSIDGTNGVAVASGATLASGVTGGITTAANGSFAVGGNLAPGDFGKAGTLTLGLGTGGKLNFASGSTLDFDLGLTAGSSDLIAFSTAGDWLGGSGNVALTLSGIGSGIDYGETYTLFSNVTTTGFTFSSITGYDDADYIATVSQSGDNYQLSFENVPEPNSAISLLGGVGLLLVLRRRRSVR